MQNTTKQYTRANSFPIRHEKVISHIAFLLFVDNTSTLLINKDITEIEKTYNKELENAKNRLNSKQTVSKHGYMKTCTISKE